MHTLIEEIKAIPTRQPTPKSVPPEAVEALLRAVRTEKYKRIRLRDEALLALLIYAGLRAYKKSAMSSSATSISRVAT